MWIEWRERSITHTTNSRLSSELVFAKCIKKMTDFQKANSVYDEKITQLIASLRIAVASLKDYRDEDRTYRVDAKSMIDVISSLELIEPKKE